MQIHVYFSFCSCCCFVILLLLCRWVGGRVAGSNIALRSDENAVSQDENPSERRKHDSRCPMRFSNWTKCASILWTRVSTQMTMKLDINVSLSFYLTAFWMTKKHNLTIINVYPFSTERCSHWYLTMKRLSSKLHSLPWRSTASIQRSDVEDPSAK